MFIRYDVNYPVLTNSQAWLTVILNDIAGALSGSITTPTGFNNVACNTATSLITGGPLSNIKLDNGTTPVYGTIVVGTPTTNALIFTKKHSAYGSHTGYTPETYFHIYANNTTYGIRTRMSATNGSTGMYPYGSPNYWWIDSGYDSALHPTTISRINIYASKYWFIMQVTDSSGRVFTSGLYDFESTLEDVYHYKNTNAYSIPTIGMQSQIMSVSPLGPASTDDRFAISRQYYPNVNGTVTANIPSYANEYTNEKNPGVAYGYTLTPALTEGMAQNYAEGYTGIQNKLSPVFLEAYGFDMSAPAAKMRKIFEIYRTTDELLVNGEQITIDGINYRNMVLHKTAFSNSINLSVIHDSRATRNACYLVPEIIGGY